MSNRLAPEDFPSLTMLEEAQRLVREAETLAPMYSLDPRTAMFVLTAPAWLALVKELADTLVEKSTGYPASRTLLGYPVRVTAGDLPDTPMIQLVMELKVRAPK